MTTPEERWVIHVPVVASDLNRARIFARTATRALALLTSRIDAGEVTVSAEDAQGVRHRVFCDRRLAGGGRCTLPTDHTSPCTRSGLSRHRQR
ncbi:hypothetical protein CA850_28615 [Micromonospora echinospora]|uniref:Uncharacterized protein n=1 Tax=Micromonospora echinospora TaxID=1877 RepID=A0A1C4VS81_MICEC|nr:hypothetical protein [Micromonospora echinospora]OZV75597.1 hypothetical protein CA850_28615 [Micromonospora echinospora]SCE86843.1 hypothetical protein GA0070618_1515 [Micromonospora echinospora]